MTHFVVGLIALALGVCGIVCWWDEFGEFLRGFVPVVLILVGLAAIGSGAREQAGEQEFDESDEAAPEPEPEE